MNVGVFGGTFDPIHLGHLRAAEEVGCAMGLEQILLIPSATPPHKDAGAAPAEQRLAMARLAAASNPRFEVCGLELERPGPSYTVDTLRRLAGDRPTARLWFILGSDAFSEIDTWREPATLFELASFCVMRRPGHEGRSLQSLMPRSLVPMLETHEVRDVAVTQLEISATDIRRRVARGASIRYLVPDPVLDYICKYELYRENS